MCSTAIDVYVNGPSQSKTCNLQRERLGRHHKEAEEVVLPVEGPAPLNDIVHGPNSLLNGSGCIRTMAEDQVNILQLHALQGSL